MIVGGVDRGLRGETRFPFFPLPFRGPDASICYPARGMGWYMGDDVLAALEWIKTFCPNDERLKFEIVRALEFVPVNDAMPFAFIPDYFDKRGNQDGKQSERKIQYPRKDHQTRHQLGLWKNGTID